MVENDTSESCGLDEATRNYVMSEPVQEVIRKKIMENDYIPKMDGRFPTSNQLLFMIAPHEEIYYAGGTGGGKSMAMFCAALMDVEEPRYRAVIFARTLQSLYLPGKLIEKSQEWLSGKACRWRDKQHYWDFPSGARIYFGYVENDEQLKLYQGTQYDFMGFEEVNTIRPNHYLFFNRSARTTRPGVRIKIRSNANPGGNFSKFYLNRFVLAPSPDRLMIFTTAHDNPGIENREQYLKRMEELDPVTRARYMEGDMLIQEQGCLFSPEKIIMADPPKDKEPIEIVRAWDIAGTAPTYTSPDPDYSAGVRISRYDDGTFLIDDLVFLREAPMGVENAVKTTSTFDGPGVRLIMEEQPGGAGKHLTEHFKNNVLPNRPIKWIKASGSKIDRARALAAGIDRGIVRIARKEIMNHLVEQMTMFDGSRGHDDFVDAASMAYNDMIYPANEGVVLDLTDDFRRTFY